MELVLSISVTVYYLVALMIIQLDLGQLLALNKKLLK